MTTIKRDFRFLLATAFLLGSTFSCIRDGKVYMTYEINNQIQNPMFTESIELELSPKRPLIHYMEQAVLTDPDNFTRFVATFSSPYGYFIDSINGVAGNWAANKTYWQILNKDGPLTVGVSSYIPKPGDWILFNFTTGGH